MPGQDEWLPPYTGNRNRLTVLQVHKVRPLAAVRRRQLLQLLDFYRYLTEGQSRHKIDFPAVCMNSKLPAVPRPIEHTSG